MNDKKQTLHNKYVWKNNKKLSFGYTTGSCAAGAAKAAAQMFISGKEISRIELCTPKGIWLTLLLEQATISEDFAECAVRKDSGDDPDVTDGMLVFARVKRSSGVGCRLTAGTGIGVVTKKGLEQDVGQPAINKVPRKMILQEVKDICEELDYPYPLEVEISAPEGGRLAGRTFNPRLGIEGGISILGTTGIVEPMSEQAIVDTIFLEMRMKKEQGKQYLIVAPGNYGLDFAGDELGVDAEQVIKCSNFIGKVLDKAAELEFKGVLFVAHIGKFIKVSGGIMNTHSRNGDARMELLAAHGLRAGITGDTASEILAAVTTEEGISILKKAERLEPSMVLVMESIRRFMSKRVYEKLKTEAIVFSNHFGEIGRTDGVDMLLEQIKRGE